MMNDEWIDTCIAKDKYLSRITSGVYVMQSKPNSFRAGAFGYKITTALKRLGQVNAAHNRKNTGLKFKFLFLAPLPNDLGHDLGRAEALLQRDISDAFHVNAKAPVFTTGCGGLAIRNIATKSVLCFLMTRYAGTQAGLTNALDEFVNMQFHQDPNQYRTVQEFLNCESARANVFEEARKIFSIGLARALLSCLNTAAP